MSSRAHFANLLSHFLALMDINFLINKDTCRNVAQRMILGKWVSLRKAISQIKGGIIITQLLAFVYSVLMLFTSLIAVIGKVRISSF